MGDGRERFRSPQDALGRLDDDPGLEHGSSPGENLRAHIASLTPFARLAPYSALPLFRALPALSLNGAAAERALWQTSRSTARLARSAPACARRDGDGRTTAVSADRPWASARAEAASNTACTPACIHLSSETTFARDSDTEQELLPLAHSFYQSLAAAAADPGAVRSGLEEASGKEFLAFLRRSGRQRAVWGDYDRGGLSHFRDFLNPQGRRRKRKKKRPQRGEQGAGQSPLGLLVSAEGARTLTANFRSDSRSAFVPFHHALSQVEHQMATPILQATSPGPLSVGALCPESGAKEDSSPRVKTNDVKTQLFFAPDRMWLPRGEAPSAAQGSIAVEPSASEAAGSVPTDEEGAAIETSERPASLFFAPDHMWMPADRRLQHERQKQEQSGSAEAPYVPVHAAATEPEETSQALKSSPGIEALRQAAAELSVAAAAAVQEASSAESSVENFVTAENLSDDDDLGGEVRKLQSEREQKCDAERLAMGADEAGDQVLRSVWEGVSAFDFEAEQESPESHCRRSTPPRVRFSGETEDGQNPSAAISWAAEALVDGVEDGGDNVAGAVGFGCVPFESKGRVHGNHDALHQHAACSSVDLSSSPVSSSLRASATTRPVGVVSSITVPEWARGVANKYFQRRAEAEARAQQKALRRQEKLETSEAREPEHLSKSPLARQSPPNTMLSPARHALLPRTTQHGSSQNSPSNTLVSAPCVNFIRTSSPSAVTDSHLPHRAPLHDFFPVPRTAARRSVSPIEATSLVDPTSAEGLSPEGSWIAAGAPMGNDAGVRDYQGVLPTLKSSPEVTPTLLAVGDRIKNCFDAFDCSTPRALYEPDVCIASSDVPVAPESEKPSSSPRLWEPYTPLKPRAAHDAAHRPQQRPCPWFATREDKRKQKISIGRQDTVTPVHRSSAIDKTSTSYFSALRRAAENVETPGSQLRRAAVREIATELGRVNDVARLCEPESIEFTRDSNTVDDFVYNTFERLRAQSVEPVSSPDGSTGRELDKESSSEMERDPGAPTERQPVVQFSCRSSPATSPDKSPGKISVMSDGSAKSSTSGTSPPAAEKWWKWECVGCYLKFCSKMLYDEHLLECPRAILGYPSGKDNKNAPARIPSAADDSLSMSTTEPTLSAASKNSPVSTTGSPVDDETDEGIALAKFLGAHAQDGGGRKRSPVSLERLKYSPLSPVTSTNENFDLSEGLAVPTLSPELEEAEQVRRVQERDRELAKERELDTVPQQMNGQARSTGHVSQSTFDLSEDEIIVKGWLRSLCLESLWPAFETEGVDAEALAVLSDEELKSVGVLRVGDRAKLRARAQRYFTGHSWAQPSSDSMQSGTLSLASEMDVVGACRTAGDTAAGAKYATPHVSQSRAAPRYAQGAVGVMAPMGSHVEDWQVADRPIPVRGLQAIADYFKHSGITGGVSDV